MCDDAPSRKVEEMDHKAEKIDHLLGALTLEEKVGQIFLFGLSGPAPGPDVEEFAGKYNIGGFLGSPYMRRFKRYLPAGSLGLKNVLRPPRLLEKMWDENVPPFHARASEYAEMLNDLRRRALERKHGIPLYITLDYESGEGSSFLPPGLVDFPSHRGFGRLGDADLIRRAAHAAGRQITAMGFNQNYSPVVDVNRNPMNTGIGTRSYGPEPELVAECARAELAGYREAGLIGTLKHFPGCGVSEPDAHYGIGAVPLSRAEMDDILLAPYKALCPEGIVPSVMIAHISYPALDPSGEVATVSKPIITGVLREEIGFDGVVTTDSITMGGLMAKYIVTEAAVRAIEAGVDVVMLKDDNALRYEALAAVADAVRSGRLTEERINQSLRRIWSLLWDYGLFENGGVVETAGLDEFLLRDEFRAIGREAAERLLHVMRQADGALPLTSKQKVLLIDRITSAQLAANHSWQHPGMLHEFMRRYSNNVTCVDYRPDTLAAATETVNVLAPQADVLVVTANFSRAVKEATKPWIADLKRFGKPVILATNNPQPLIVPDEVETVICTYSNLRTSSEALARFLYAVGD